MRVVWVMLSGNGFFARVGGGIFVRRVGFIVVGGVVSMKSGRE